jgi:CDP-diacylglycerol---serine O-phosphatidyltransferase
MSVSDVTAFPEPIVKATAIRERSTERAPAATTADSAVEQIGPADVWSLSRQVTLANALTTASLLVGLAALFEAARARASMPDATLRLIVGLICTAAVLDAVDGPLARLRGTAGPFGCNLDSLADMVSFGAAPAVALFLAQLHTVPVAGLIASAAFCTCAAWRLARFPLCKSSAAFVGCPVPLAAVIAGIVAVTASSPIVTLVTVGALSWMMVGTMAFPTWTRVLGGSRPAREP